VSLTSLRYVLTSIPSSLGSVDRTAAMDRDEDWCDDAWTNADTSDPRRPLVPQKVNQPLAPLGTLGRVGQGLHARRQELGIGPIAASGFCRRAPYCGWPPSLVTLQRSRGSQPDRQAGQGIACGSHRIDCRALLCAGLLLSFPSSFYIILSSHCAYSTTRPWLVDLYRYYVPTIAYSHYAHT
jgi:hypothetical protein